MHFIFIFAAVTIQLIAFLVGECEMASQNPTTAAEFQSALDQANPGDVITLSPMTYVGNFYISNNGQEGSLITITGTKVGDKSTILTSNSGKVFDIGANFVKIEKMKITHGNIAVHVQGNQNVLTGLHIAGENGVVLSGNQNAVNSCDIECSEVAILIKRGHGNDISSNILSSLTIWKGAWGGVLSFVIIKGPFDIQGSKYTIKNVEAQGNVNIQGCDNELNSVALKVVSRIASCNHLDSVSFNLS